MLINYNYNLNYLIIIYNYQLLSIIIKNYQLLSKIIIYQLFDYLFDYLFNYLFNM